MSESLRSHLEVLVSKWEAEAQEQPESYDHGVAISTIGDCAKVLRAGLVASESDPEHILLFPPHPDGYFISSALCSCGQFQWDADTAESVLLQSEIVYKDWETHVKSYV